MSYIPGPAATPKKFSWSDTPLAQLHAVQLVECSDDLNLPDFLLAKTLEQSMREQIAATPYYWICMWLKDTRIIRKKKAVSELCFAPAYSMNINDPDVPFEFEILNETEALHIFIHPGVLREVAIEQGRLEIAENFLKPVLGVENKGLTFLLRSLKQTLIDEHKRSVNMAEHLVKGLCSELLTRYSRERGAFTSYLGNGHKFSARQVRSIVEYIDRTLSGTPDLNAMASMCSVGRTTFGARFKSTFGITPYQYIIKKRIDLAKKMLIDGSVSHLEIATLCGFADQAHFATLFKREVGLTPFNFKRNSSDMEFRLLKDTG